MGVTQFVLLISVIKREWLCFCLSLFVKSISSSNSSLFHVTLFLCSSVCYCLVKRNLLDLTWHFIFLYLLFIPGYIIVKRVLAVDSDPVILCRVVNLWKHPLLMHQPQSGNQQKPNSYHLNVCNVNTTVRSSLLSHTPNLLHSESDRNAKDVEHSYIYKGYLHRP